LLKIELEYKRGILFIRLNGSLNNNTSYLLKDAISNAVLKGGIKYLVINFEKLYSVDDKGLSSIVCSYKEYLNIIDKIIICGYQDNKNIKIENTELKKYASFALNELSACNLINI